MVDKGAWWVKKRSKEGWKRVIWIDFRLQVKECRNTEESAACLETPNAMGRGSPNWIHKHFWKVGLVSSGIQGPKGEQRLIGLGDVYMKKNQQILCCDRTSEVDLLFLIYLDEFVSLLRCEYAYSIRQGLRVLSAHWALHAGRDYTTICLVRWTSQSWYLNLGCCCNSCWLLQVLQSSIYVTGNSVVSLMDKSGQKLWV